MQASRRVFRVALLGYYWTSTTTSIIGRWTAAAFSPTSSTRLQQRVGSRVVSLSTVSIATAASLVAASKGSNSDNQCSYSPRSTHCQNQQHPRKTVRRMSVSQSRTSSGESSMTTTGYLNAKDAAALDQELMSTPGFSLDQLMELAGLSVAEAVYAVSPPTSTHQTKVVIVCGPGNNGGDGLVAARHLVMFGYEAVTAVYPKRSSKQHFVNLVQQCLDVGVTVQNDLPPLLSEEEDETTTEVIVVDAIFGFSFHGEPREPFATMLQQMMVASSSSNVVLSGDTSNGNKKVVTMISVDVPSGWSVDGGDVSETGFMPDVLVSLTAPKLSAAKFTGRHFVGGRFLPPKLAHKYGIQMPPYPGVSQVMELPNNKQTTCNEKDDDWALEYEAYLTSKESETTANNDAPNNLSKTDASNTNQGGDGDVYEEWAIQYAEHCAEQEEQLRQSQSSKKQ